MWQQYRRQKAQAQMSDQEFAVLNGIMRGDRDREIAVYLGISHSLVRQSGVTLRRKLKAKSRTDLAMRALELGFAVGPAARAAPANAQDVGVPSRIAPRGALDPVRHRQ